MNSFNNKQYKISNIYMYNDSICMIYSQEICVLIHYSRILFRQEFLLAWETFVFIVLFF